MYDVGYTMLVGVGGNEKFVTRAIHSRDTFGENCHCTRRYLFLVHYPTRYTIDTVVEIHGVEA